MRVHDERTPSPETWVRAEETQTPPRIIGMSIGGVEGIRFHTTNPRERIASSAIVAPGFFPFHVNRRQLRASQGIGGPKSARLRHRRTSQNFPAVISSNAFLQKKRRWPQQGRGSKGLPAPLACWKDYRQPLTDGVLRPLCVRCRSAHRPSNVAAIFNPIIAPGIGLAGL